MDKNPALFLTILAAGILTFLIRLSFIALHGRIKLPEWFTRGLTFVPVAVLSAIILPELVVAEGALSLSLSNVRLLAGIAATLVAWRTKNVWATIVVGMGLLFGIQFLMK